MSSGSSGKHSAVTAVAAALREQDDDDVDGLPDSPAFEDTEIRDLAAFLDGLGVGWRETPEAEALLHSQATKSRHSAVRGDELGLMQWHRGRVDTDTEREDAIPYLWDRLKEGGFTAVFGGGGGSGKTHAALWLAWLAYQLLDVEPVVTNVPLDDPDVHLEADQDVVVRLDGDEVTELDPELIDVDRDERDVELLVDDDDRLDELLEATQVRVERESHLRRVVAAIPGELFVVIDEWGTNDEDKSHQGTDELARLIRAIRHDPWRAKLAVIGHYWTDIPPAVRETLSSIVIEKPTQRRMKIGEKASENGLEDVMIVVPDVPSHGFDDYNDRGSTRWQFDGGSAEDEAGLEGLSAEQLATIAQQRVDAGESIRSIGEDPDFPRKRTWVSDHVET